MFFKITSKTLSNEKQINFFNSDLNTVYDSEFNLINLKEDPRLINFVNEKQISTKKKVFKKNNINHLRIQIGLNCNFSCKYCNQGGCREIDNKTKILQPPLKLRIKNFINSLIENNIQVAKNIALWGGEPLVYWKTLKVLIPELATLYPKAGISFITNGSLLTEEIVDFLIKYRVNVTLSHDAQGFKAYRDDKDPLEDPKILKCIQRYIDACTESNIFWGNLSEEEKQKEENIIKYRPFCFSINTVITPANLDIDKIPGYFSLKINRVFPFHFESIVKADVKTKQLMGSLTEEQKNLVTSKIFKNALVNSTDFTENPFYSLRESLGYIFNILVNQQPSSNYEVKCDVVSDKILAIDLDGNILACHGADAENWTIGHISNVNNTINYKVKGWSQRPHCPSCPLKSFCAGGCVIASDEDSQAMCEYLKVYHGALFAAAWFDLFNVIIEKIEPCPEKENECSSE